MDNKKEKEDINMYSEVEYFSKRTREIMEIRKISREKLASMCDIKSSTLDTYLRNFSKKSKAVLPNVLTASKIAKALDVSLDYLIGISKTKAFKSEENTSALAVLKNLVKVIEDLNIDVKIDNSNKSVSLVSNNPYFNLFLSQYKQLDLYLSKEKKSEKINKLYDLYKDYVVVDGNILDLNAYLISRYPKCIYEGITTEDIEGVNSEYYSDAIYKREEEWEKAKETGDFSYFRNNT